MSDPIESGGTKESRFSRRGLIAGTALMALVAGGGWLGWSFLVEGRGAEAVASPDVLYLDLLDVTATLTDPPRLARLGLALETTADAGRLLDQPAQLRLVEEIRRWLATRASTDLYGAAALWTVRGQVMALLRDLHPELPVHDVLIRTLILQ